MASIGTTVKDILPIPDNIDIVTDPYKEEISRSLADESTMSHALAVTDPDEKGHAQEESHDSEVQNLGWNEPDEQIPDPLVSGLSNDDLWILVRRFNKQLYHVKELTRPAPGNLDLNLAEDDEFSPDKLRATIERLYMTVIVGLLAVVKHIARLRSWRETRRTGAFCAAYFLAWLLDFLVPFFSLTVIALIVYPSSRDVLFPSAPLSLVSTKHGGVQKPKAGVLGSTDSATGAPENFKGEAVEAEATNFVNSIAQVALSSASGKHPEDDPSDNADDGVSPSARVPDPTVLAAGVGDARVNAAGGEVSPKQDKTKVPMETAMWNQMRPVMHGIADIADTWERFGNALAPTPPFPRDTYRLRLAALLVPLLAVSIFVSSYMFVKGLTFGLGLGFFGDPVIQRGLSYLNSQFPHWQKLLELRNTVLKGVPTNAQLTLTLLRIGEANKAPLPPPPSSDHPPPDEPVDLTEADLQAAGADRPLSASDEELQAAIESEPKFAGESTGEDVEASKKKSHGKKAARVLSAVRHGLKGSIETVLGADHVKAKAGSEVSKQRLGVVPRHRRNHLSGPTEFKCRYHGKRGYAYISTSATSPCVSFSLNTISSDGTQEKDDNRLKPVWSVAVADIKDIKKVGGLGWKAKLVVGWSLEREIADGIEIQDRLGNEWVLTAMVLRDELFNRLVAMGGQKWEAY